MTGPPEHWRLRHDGREHVVEIVDGALRRTLVWQVDGVTVATRRTGDARVVLDGAQEGAVLVRLPEFAGPARRVAWHPPGQPLDAALAARTGLGGLDLEPDPGSAAAARLNWIRDHPRLHVARRSALAAGGVLLSLLGAWLLAHVPWPAVSIPWPAVSIPWPDLPWPDLRIPWPHWQLPELPAWVATVRDAAKYGWPVVLAFAVARAEVRRPSTPGRRRWRVRGSGPSAARPRRPRSARRWPHGAAPPRPPAPPGR